MFQKSIGPLYPTPKCNWYKRLEFRERYTVVIVYKVESRRQSSRGKTWRGVTRLKLRLWQQWGQKELVLQPHLGGILLLRGHFIQRLTRPSFCLLVRTVHCGKLCLCRSTVYSFSTSTTLCSLQALKQAFQLHLDKPNVFAARQSDLQYSGLYKLQN